MVFLYYLFLDKHIFYSFLYILAPGICVLCCICCLISMFFFSSFLFLPARLFPEAQAERRERAGGERQSGGGAVMQAEGPRQIPLTTGEPTLRDWPISLLLPTTAVAPRDGPPHHRRHRWRSSCWLHWIRPTPRAPTRPSPVTLTQRALVQREGPLCGLWDLIVWANKRNRWALQPLFQAALCLRGDQLAIFINIWIIIGTASMVTPPPPATHHKCTVSFQVDV